MPSITASMSGGAKYCFGIRPFEIARYYKNEGKELFPERPKFPWALWVLDLAIINSKAAFKGQKPIRVKIESNRGFLND